MEGWKGKNAQKEQSLFFLKSSVNYIVVWNK